MPFDLNDKGESAIVEKEGASCSGSPGIEMWSVACGEPIDRGRGGGHRRMDFKLIDVKEGVLANVGVMPDAASRDQMLGKQEGSVCLDHMGNFYVDGRYMRDATGFYVDGSFARPTVAVLKTAGGLVVAFYVDGKECTREPLPDEGDYRFAVGSLGDGATFEMAAKAFEIDDEVVETDTATELLWTKLADGHLLAADELAHLEAAAVDEVVETGAENAEAALAAAADENAEEGSVENANALLLQGARARKEFRAKRLAEIAAAPPAAEAAAPAPAATSGFTAPPPATGCGPDAEMQAMLYPQAEEPSASGPIE